MLQLVEFVPFDLQRGGASTLVDAFGGYTPSVYSAMDSAGHHAVVFAVVRLLELVLGRRRPFRRAVVILVLLVVFTAAVRAPLPEMWPAMPVLP
jgi:hypothetical protein